MNLKEAFRYQNKIQSLMDNARSILEYDENITRTENTYLRHKIMPEAEDEVVVDVPETEYYENITDIVRFMLYLLSKKEKLSEEIRKTKNTIDFDLDSEVGLNTTRRDIALIFKHMNDLRGSEHVIPGGGIGYRFNADGNQTTYRCDVKRVRTINYDRKLIHRELVRLNKRADEISSKIDFCVVTAEVDYEPIFDVNSSFAQAFEDYMSKADA